MPRPTIGSAQVAVALSALLLCTSCSDSVAGAGTGSDAESGSPNRAVDPGAAASISFDRDIRPLLSDRCFTCHGPDANKRRANLRLDVRDAAVLVTDGLAAIVPGDADASELVRRATADDPKERMPPASSGKRPISAEEAERLARWIRDGARYEPHWSFVAPARPAIPQVARTDWVKNPIDTFVLARLEASGIAPNPDADDETLVRRVFLDLTGLPPTPEEIDRYLADSAPDRWERLVDRLLNEEPYVTRFAERMATPWLDAARYADTCGIHTDAGRQIWEWRDWVLRAFRDNLPFDRFLTEQLAGDLLPDSTPEQKIATGFLRNHVTSDEGGAIAEEYLVEYAVERAATTGSVFLGLTLGCARCHEHKFDPVSQDEFYRFYAFFNSIEEPGLYSQLPDPNRAFEPFLVTPRPEQKVKQDELRAQLAAEKAAIDEPSPGEDGERASFLAAASADVTWDAPRPTAAVSTGGATLTIEPDGSVLASGANPDQDDHVVTIHTDEVGSRLLLLEAIQDPSLPEGRIGRAFNGNAVLTGVSVEAVSTADPTLRRTVRLVWAWADHEQDNGDYAVTNALGGGSPRADAGWAVDAHRKEGGRVAMFLADAPFGFPGGTDLIVKLAYRSVYAGHVLGRVRLRAGKIKDAALARLPTASSAWFLVGPFPADSGKSAFATAYGPEEGVAIDHTKNFGGGNQAWRHGLGLFDGIENNGLPQGVNASYVGKTVFAPTARKVDVALGSDDGLRVFVDGKDVFSREVDRALMRDQDKASFELDNGAHAIVLKVVNTGGAAGFYWNAERGKDELTGDLAFALVPQDARDAERERRLAEAWKLAFSSAYRGHRDKIVAIEKSLAELEAQFPRTMVMQELPMARDTFVLQRGQYDHPDQNRKVERAVPAFLGQLPADAPKNRLGLAYWMTSPSNPLVARVAVNRTWEQVFGQGLVRTTEDFGHQGEWPSHKELLDWLAVEFRETGWDVKKLVRLLVTSRTYRQSPRSRPELAESDPDNRLLAHFPRKRLWAEAIRDQALFIAGLLVERTGGPSVKPYQPEGLWQEVAMPASNTRFYTRGEGDDLWRRSLYTYWKRACPPPAMLTLDAPTRETCVVRRSGTNTPLQALVLWNDEQLVEAARMLAARTLGEDGDDRARLSRMHRRVVGRAPDAASLDDLVKTLGEFRARYAAEPKDAEALVKQGMARTPLEANAPELAAWTVIASALFDLDAAVTRG